MKSPFLISAETKQSRPSHSTLALSNQTTHPAVLPLDKHSCDINLYKASWRALYSIDLLKLFYFSWRMSIKLYMHRPRAFESSTTNKQRTLRQFTPVAAGCARALIFRLLSLVKAFKSPGSHYRIYKSKSACDNTVLIAMYRRYNMT